MSVEARCIELALEGIRPSEIARIVNRTPATVYGYIAAARRNGVKIPAFLKGKPKGSHIWVPRKAVIMLRSAARRRQMTPDELAERLLGVVATSGLIDAVLDDGVSDA